MLCEQESNVGPITSANGFSSKIAVVGFGCSPALSPYWPLQTLGFSERLSGGLAPLASLTSLQKIVLALCQFS
jgi:hypothetical protein